MLRRIIELSMVGHGSGPVWNIIQTCSKYNLLDIFLDAIHTGEYVSIKEWKKNVRTIVCQKDIKCLQVKSKLYKSMAMINMSALDGSMLQWWWSAYKCPHFTKQCKLIVKLLLNVYKLGRNTCNQCTLYKSNSVQP